MGEELPQPPGQPPSGSFSSSRAADGGRSTSSIREAGFARSTSSSRAADGGRSSSSISLQADREGVAPPCLSAPLWVLSPDHLCAVLRCCGVLGYDNPRLLMVRGVLVSGSVWSCAFLLSVLLLW